MAKIKNIQAREILAADTKPTIEVFVELNDGTIAKSSCPIGYKAGEYESFSMFERDDNGEILSVKKVIENITNIIAPKLIGQEASKQQQIDHMLIELDGTQNKIKLGANAMLATSQAIAKASAKVAKLPLFLYLREFISKNPQIRIPTTIFSAIAGSKKVNSNIDFEEILVLPTSSSSLENSIKLYKKINQKILDYLKSKNEKFLISPRGAYSPNAQTNEESLSILKEIISDCGYQLGFDLFLGVDAAADNFYEAKKYKLADRESSLDAKSLISFYESLVTDYHILYLEDPIYEQDLESWQNLTNSISRSTIVVSDRMTATNLYRLQMALDKKSITGMSIKPIQTGTVIEALATAEVAKAAGIKIVVSSRTFETDDDFIADFAVAVGADYIKFGAPTRGEHIAKYNRLSKIEEQIKML